MVTIAEILLKVALKHQKIKSKADYINNHILNVFKYIFNIQQKKWGHLGSNLKIKNEKTHLLNIFSCE
jgi:hypothetical protein